MGRLTTFEKFRLEGITALIKVAAGFLVTEHAPALLESGSNIILTAINVGALLASSANLSLSLNW